MVAERSPTLGTEGVRRWMGDFGDGSMNNLMWIVGSLDGRPLRT
jgi:hypothetical protein